MQVKEAMTSEVECIGPDDTIHQAAQQMKSLDVGSLPVCEDDRVVGMITDRDIVIRSIAQGHNPRETHVRESMSSDVFYCYDDQPVSEIARVMREKQVRRLPVMNREKRLVGIVSLGDLAVDTGDDQLVGNALEGISEPAAPKR
jgi:CBS domain-containing protein